MWRDYKINKNPRNHDGIGVDNNLEENLFYDLLIEYIKDKKYLKNNYRDYEN